MIDGANRWTLILAAGAGTRLSPLTMDGRGGAVPKQFCSLNGGPSLLEETLSRAHAFSARRRTVVVVAAEHRVFWQRALAGLPAENAIVQPANRGTANGILLGVSAILARDPEALVTVLPSDHYVAREDVLRRSVSLALALAEQPAGAEAIHFLGIRPETVDPELGYIVRGEPRLDGSFEIGSFVEKPSRERAKELVRERALWNSFILVARAAALVALVERRFPAEVAAFTSLWRRAGIGAPAAGDVQALYATLAQIDFSRRVVEGTAAPLRVVPVPYCGWSDLGTPERVAACLERLEARRMSTPSRHFNLAEACARATRSMLVAEQSA
jgi:mannose-1-phosphate guanylyltransferase